MNQSLAQFCVRIEFCRYFNNTQAPLGGVGQRQFGDDGANRARSEGKGSTKTVDSLPGQVAGYWQFCENDE